MQTRCEIHWFCPVLSWYSSVPELAVITHGYLIQIASLLTTSASISSLQGFQWGINLVSNSLDLWLRSLQKALLEQTMCKGLVFTSVPEQKEDLAFQRLIKQWHERSWIPQQNLRQDANTKCCLSRLLLGSEHTSSGWLSDLGFFILPWWASKGEVTPTYKLTSSV